ncbi:MAG TPA: hypothetical protein VIV88_01165 [Gemmatimonadales bacterium]|jgi:hypothetical protein
MRDSAPHRLTERRQAILRQASAALRGRPVTLWRMANGGAVAELVSQPNPPRDAIEFDVAAALRFLGLTGPEGSRWVVCRLEPEHWQVAPVRRDLPAPPPSGVERRSPERLTLELAALLLGALERLWTVTDQATVYLCAALAVIEAAVQRVRDVRGLTTGARAHLLADLAIIADAIEGALNAA